MSKTLEIIPKEQTPPAQKKSTLLKGIPKLSNLREIRTEMSRIYRATFYQGKLLPEDYTKAMFGLRILAEIVEATDFEDRLQQLEDGKP